MMEIIRFCTHYGMHFLFPGAIAFVFFKGQWKKVWLIFILANFIDLDHLLSNPIFSSTRCSINNHLLHSYIAIVIYFIFLFFKKTRIIGFALLFHMVTDLIDCWWIK